MRISALPNFRKLYRRIENGLPVGSYAFDINYGTDNYEMNN
jgi:LEM3 (ligand-effect modulator 3) family/CDC50 family protein